MTIKKDTETFEDLIIEYATELLRNGVPKNIIVDEILAPYYTFLLPSEIVEKNEKNKQKVLTLR